MLPVFIHFTKQWIVKLTFVTFTFFKKNLIIFAVWEFAFKACLLGVTNANFFSGGSGRPDSPGSFFSNSSAQTE